MTFPICHGCCKKSPQAHWLLPLSYGGQRSLGHRVGRAGAFWRLQGRDPFLALLASRPLCPLPCLLLWLTLLPSCNKDLAIRLPYPVTSGRSPHGSVLSSSRAAKSCLPRKAVPPQVLGLGKVPLQGTAGWPHGYFAAFSFLLSPKLPSLPPSVFLLSVNSSDF